MPPYPIFPFFVKTMGHTPADGTGVLFSDIVSDLQSDDSANLPPLKFLGQNSLFTTEIR